MGLMFDTVHYEHDGLTNEMVTTIDTFFDSLEWNSADAEPHVPLVPYGDLMMLVDMNNRWVYKGSVTTPPCDTYVYWNVLRRVLPIKKKHLELFKKQLAKGNTAKINLETTGNYREIQELDHHDPYIVFEHEELFDATHLDTVEFHEKADGTVLVEFADYNGPFGKIHPLHSGSIEIEYKKNLDRKISQTQSHTEKGFCQSINMCNFH